MKNHLIKIHNHADVSTLPLLQLAMRNDYESELDQSGLNNNESIEDLGIELANHPDN
jgi:hypothetical protein